MNPFVAELLGTLILILVGNGVVANCNLKATKGNGAGWLVITTTWGLTVFMAVYITMPYSGAHLNPAVTIGMALIGKFAWAKVISYIIAQMVGAMLGAFLVWLMHKPHYDITEDQESILSTFSTSPAIRKPFFNFISEVIGTFMLVYAAYFILSPKVGEMDASLGALDALPIGLVVWVIGLGLGGTTGYAINPARDLGPRVVHALLPIKNKGTSDWGYAWIPVLGPVFGAALAAGLYFALGS